MKKTVQLFEGFAKILKNLRCEVKEAKREEELT